jgi:hypothetical protein
MAIIPSVRVGNERQLIFICVSPVSVLCSPVISRAERQGNFTGGNGDNRRKISAPFSPFAPVKHSGRPRLEAARVIHQRFN